IVARRNESSSSTIAITGIFDKSPSPVTNVALGPLFRTFTLPPLSQSGWRRAICKRYQGARIVRRDSHLLAFVRNLRCPQVLNRRKTRRRLSKLLSRHFVESDVPAVVYPKVPSRVFPF